MSLQTGTKISLAGHGILLGWAAFGGWFSSDPLPLQVQEVAVISAQDFAKLSAQIQAPELAQTPANLAAPQTPSELELSPQTRPAPRPDLEQPDPVSAPAEEAPVDAEPQPEPEPQVSVTVPEPAPQTDVPAIVPRLPEPAPVRPADRVAPVPVEAPDPEVKIDDLVQPEIAQDRGAEQEQEAQEATAPEAASDRIATEANTDEDAEQTPSQAEPEQRVETAPTTSIRPRRRPQRPEPAEQVAQQPAESTSAASDTETAQRSAIEDALATAIAGGETVADEPSGPPLTLGEKDALRVSVSKCWNVGSLSSEALKTTVEVAVSLEPDGTITPGSVRMVSSTGGSSGAAKQAYEAARRAIIRCGARGFQLPVEKYDHWRDIVMTFNPEKMRIK